MDIPEPYRRIAQTTKHGGLFKDVEGPRRRHRHRHEARLWKGEIGGYVIKAGIQQPWDLLPVWGISEKLGFIVSHTD